MKEKNNPFDIHDQSQQQMQRFLTKYSSQFLININMKSYFVNSQYTRST